MACLQIARAVVLMASTSNAAAVKCVQDLTAALSYCNAPATQTLLDSYPAQKTCHSGHGQPLHIVSQFFCSHVGDDCFKSFKVLLDSGADPNAKNPKTGMTALHMLINEFGGANECRSGADFLKQGLSLLISYGADSEALDDRRRSVVDLAKSKGASQDIIALLEGRAEAPGDDNVNANAAGQNADEDNDVGSEKVMLAMVCGAVAGVVLLCAFIYLYRKKNSLPQHPSRKQSREQRERTSKGAVSIPILKHVSTTSQVSQGMARTASGTPAPMIIIAPASSSGEP
jgi:hypothetical protein